jgi:hypothetical protein
MAGLLSDSGYYRGDQLLRPKEDNPKGFFEDRHINDLNERIMRSVIPFTRMRLLHRWFPRIPLRSNGWMALLPLDATVRTSAQQQLEISSLTERTPFCFKDPRFSYTYPGWKPFVGDAVMIVVFRHPAEVCASIISFFRRRRVGYTPSFIFAVWLRVHEHIIKHIREGGPWLVVNYDDLLSGSNLVEIETRIGSRVNRAMIDESLNRSKATAFRFTPPAACLAMYERLTALSSGIG